MTDKNFQYYKNLDFSNARRANENPVIKELQARKREHDAALARLLDGDVQEAIVHIDTPEDRARINAVLRALLIA